MTPENEKLINFVDNFCKQKMTELVSLIFEDLKDCTPIEFTTALLMIEDMLEKQFAITLQFCKTNEDLKNRVANIPSAILVKHNAIKQIEKIYSTKIDKENLN